MVSCPPAINKNYLGCADITPNHLDLDSGGQPAASMHLRASRRAPSSFSSNPIRSDPFQSIFRSLLVVVHTVVQLLCKDVKANILLSRKMTLRALGPLRRCVSPLLSSVAKVIIIVVAAAAAILFPIRNLFSLPFPLFRTSLSPVFRISAYCIPCDICELSIMFSGSGVA